MKFKLGVFSLGSNIWQWSYHQIANEGNAISESVLRWSNWIIYIHWFDERERERERTTTHDERRFTLLNVSLSGRSLPFQSSNKIEIRWKRTSRAMLAAQRALIQRGPGMQLFDFTVVIRQFRRLLSGIFKQRIQTNLSNACATPRPCVRQHRSVLDPRCLVSRWRFRWYQFVIVRVNDNVFRTIITLCKLISYVISC